MASVWLTAGAVVSIPGQGPEGHLVLKLENEVCHPLQIQITTLILTKIGVFDKKVLLFIYVQLFI